MIFDPHRLVLRDTSDQGHTLASLCETAIPRGITTLVAGTKVVATPHVTASSLIQLSVQTAGGTQGLLRVSARTAGVGFTITSTQASETSTVAWQILEP